MPRQNNRDAYEGLVRSFSTVTKILGVDMARMFSGEETFDNSDHEEIDDPNIIDIEYKEV